MRSIPSDVATLLASGQQVEPVMIVTVQWNAAGNFLGYADRTLYGSDGTTVLYPGSILELGALNETQRSDSSGLSGSLSVKLDDRDGTLKSIFDNNDIHKMVVRVYQGFQGLTGQVLLFSGQITTPIVWDEGSRTLAFDVTTKLEDQEVGWSAELGNYTTVAQDLIGTPWPMVFGAVQHSPGLQLQNIPTGFTTEAFGLIDGTLATQQANLAGLLQAAISATEYYSIKATDGIPWSALGTQERAIENSPEVQQYVQMQADIQAEANQLSQVQAWQGAWVKGQVNVIPTVYVNQPYTGLFRVGNSLFNGTLNKTGGTLNTLMPAFTPGLTSVINRQPQGFQFFNAGSQVVIAGPYPIQYIASITPGTVKQVWAMRSFNGLKQLAIVPPSYYKVTTQNMGKGMVATYVTLNQPLSTIAMVQNMQTQVWENDFGRSLPSHIVNQIDWEDKLYISFQSSIGPNPVDIMIWLITNFATNGYDAASFASVKASLANFPMNFTLAAMPDVLSLLTELAYQARCIIYLRDDVFHLLYLPALPAPVDTITESDIQVGSLQVTTTSTEQLITKYVATYRPDYSPFYEKPVEIILRYNIPKYGVHEEDHNFYAYNDFYSVEKAATFWMIRKSQTWKILKAKLLLTKINLEAFDAVTLHFQTPYIANGDVTGFITSCNYNSAERVIDVEIWTPVLLGTMAPSKFGWPSGLTEADIWPVYQNLAAGGGGSLSEPQLPPSNGVRLDVGQLGPDFFSTVKTPPSRLNWSSGDPYPGDTGPWVDDILPYIAQPIPIDKGFQYQGLPVPDPSQPYGYPETPDPNIPNLSGMYPGTVQSKIGPSDTLPNVINYNVNVFENGLKNPPRPRVVGQLQIDKDDVIPEGTWVYVSYRQGQKPSQPGDPAQTQDKTSYTEYTMQVPIWLN